MDKKELYEAQIKRREKTIQSFDCEIKIHKEEIDRNLELIKILKQEIWETKWKLNNLK